MNHISDAAKTEYQKALREYHKASDRHVLVLEADMTEDQRRHIFHLAELERQAGNELTSILKKRYDQMVRTKQYRNLKRLYGAAVKTDKARAKELARELQQMQADYQVTWNDCRKQMIPIGKKYGLDAVFALTKAEDIWQGMERCLYGDGKTIHFAKRGDYPVIRAKQSHTAIRIGAIDGALRSKLRDITFGVKVRDRFEQEETAAIRSYLKDPEGNDQWAVHTFLTTGEVVSTYRPCYASLVCKTIRGRLRVYVHLTIEGTAKPKYRTDGSLRHPLGSGIIGCDIGTQTIAYTTETEVGLKNLAERGSSIRKQERIQRRLYRAMDRSRRACDPQNYLPDGTVRPGPKQWHPSRRYQRLKTRYADLARKNAINRHLAIRQEVNHLRSLGDVFITEAKNAKKLMKRAKETKRTKTGKTAKKKRFGKSIQTRCPGYFQAQMAQKMKQTGGRYLEVPNHYRASQYDHMADQYIPKALSQRIFPLADGTVVQRDWYASFLLFCCDIQTMELQKERCKTAFPTQYQRMQEMIRRIQMDRIHIYNSGIRQAC